MGILINIMSIHRLFSPRSVLLLGSSRLREDQILANPRIFMRIAENIEDLGDKGTVLSIENARTFPKADLAVITLPRREVMKILPKLRARFVVILTGGFSDDQKKRMLSIAKRRGFRILGPNSVMGLINTHESLNTTFEEGIEIEPGGISVISQSGGVGATLLDLASHYRLGISKFVWIGDSMDINETEVLEYLIRDRKTKIIMAYIEGLKNPKGFISCAKKSGKPVFVMKGGISDFSKERALSHTGSMSTSSSVYSAAFRQAGIIEKESLGEMFNHCMNLDYHGFPKGNRIAVVSNTGGSAILAADWCSRYGLQLTGFSRRTRERISRRYGNIDAINPLDIIADADGERFRRVLDIVEREKKVDMIILIVQLTSCLLHERELKFLSERRSGKPVIVCAPGASDFERVSFVLKNVPVLSSVKNAAKAARNLYEVSARKR